nr:InlB B-repeat-containing protein [uncultured Ruminococcus sp.]
MRQNEGIVRERLSPVQRVQKRRGVDQKEVMMKRLLSFLLCLALLCGSLSITVSAADININELSADQELADTAADSDTAALGAEAKDTASTGYTLLTEAQFQNKLSSLRTKYPDGGFWDGVYYEGGYARAWECWAYSAQMLYEVFGVKFYADRMMDNMHYDVYGICAGDWVRIDWDSHSIFITKVTDAGVYFTDGNGTGYYNQIRWDGFYSWSEISSRFSYRLHVPGNNLTGDIVTHTVAYNPNGGTGSVSSQSVASGGSFTVKENDFYRVGYRFSGYIANRSSDNKWFCTGGKGWQSADNIKEKGYSYAVYYPNESYTMSKNWLTDLTTAASITFYAQWEPIHTVAYSPNGGTGSIDSDNLGANESFTLKENAFTREGYVFAGYTVKRSSDNKWFTSGGTLWQSQSDIYQNNYQYSIYSPGRSYKMSLNWIDDLDEATTLTFYAQWLPVSAKLEFMANYSGYNYMLGSDLTSGYSSYIYSRDKSTYSVSVDSTERLNNADSLKIVGSTEGASGSDLAFKTSTNYGYADGYSTAAPVGDDKTYYLHFYAKANVDGANMYFRWGYSSELESVTLTKNWQAYSVALPKTPYYGSVIHPYFDKTGTYYINSLALGDIPWTSNVIPESGFKAAPDQLIPFGETPDSLPTPTREGYTFTGWYTAAEGGSEVTLNTPIDASVLRLYAHWRKELTVTPVKTVKSGGHLYALYDNQLGWEDAAYFCETQGGHLVTIDSEQENDTVYSMINDRQGYCWIGLRCLTPPSGWKWVDQSNYKAYNRWYHPTYGTIDTGEYYAMIYPMNYGTAPYAGTWDKCTGSSYYCSFYGYYNSFFICEYDDPVILGDTNGNSEVEAIDATMIQRYRVGLDTDYSDVWMRGDVTGDGEINVIDATYILRYLAGMNTPFEVGEWKA